MKRNFGFFLMILLFVLVGCSDDEEMQANNRSGENTEVKDADVVEDVEENKMLGVIVANKDVNKEDSHLEETIAVENYPKVINDGDLEYTVETYDGQFMSNQSVYIRTGPGEDFDHVAYLRPAERADAFEVTEINGDTYYHINKDEFTGWILAADIVHYDKVKANTKKNNYGSPFATTVYAAFAIYTKGPIVHYKNIGWEKNGQSKFIVEEEGYAATWGGEEYFSGEDNKNTHFIGSTEQFSGLENEEEIIITDEVGAAYFYIPSKSYHVDGQGIGLDDGKDYWNEIVEVGEEERVVFQITDDFEKSLIIEFIPK